MWAIGDLLQLATLASRLDFTAGGHICGVEKVETVTASAWELIMAPRFVEGSERREWPCNSVWFHSVLSRFLTVLECLCDD